MSNDNLTQSVPKTLPPRELLTQATALCDELDQLMSFHHFYYQAVEDFFNDQGVHSSRVMALRRGLSLLPGWLRERDLEVVDRVYELQEGLRGVLGVGDEVE